MRCDLRLERYFNRAQLPRIPLEATPRAMDEAKKNQYARAGGAHIEGEAN
jgi:hypothetical protein